MIRPKKRSAPTKKPASKKRATKARARKAPAPKKRPRGGQTVYNRKLADQILTRLAEGDGLRKICKPTSMPPESTVRQWVVDDREGFAAQYARARDIGLDSRAERVPEMARRARGKDSAGVQAVRVEVDAEKWLLSKLAPKRYGDKLDLNVSGELELKGMSDEALLEQVAKDLVALGVDPKILKGLVDGTG